MSAQPNQSRPRVYEEPYEVDARLRSLGVARAWIIDATRQGDLQRKLASPNDFDGCGAYNAASRGLRALCEIGSGNGWHRGEHLTIPVVFNRDENVAIAVTGGDRYTGIVDEDRDPTTKALKGPATERAARRNTKLPFGLALYDEGQPIGVAFWYMLTYSGAELRVELSTPRVTDSQGHVVGWTERIIVGHVDDGGDYSAARAPVGGPPEIDIAVRRKSS